MTANTAAGMEHPAFKSTQGSGAPVGNQNARRSKLVRKALKEAFIELEGGAGDDDEKLQRRLRKYARGLIALAEDGDVAAYKEINDRIEGKAVQPVSGDDDGPPLLFQKIERVIVDPTASGS